MRHRLATALLAVSLAGGTAPAMAQEMIEGLTATVTTGEAFDRFDTETYVLHYSVRREDEARNSCASCAAPDGDDPSMTESQPCTFFSGWNLDECLAGIDRGGHSKGKYL